MSTVALKVYARVLFAAVFAASLAGLLYVQSPTTKPSNRHNAVLLSDPRPLPHPARHSPPTPATPPPPAPVAPTQGPSAPAAQPPAPPPPAPVVMSDLLAAQPSTLQALAACIRQAENDGSYEWGFPFGTGDGGGAYQFEPSTWDEAARLAGVTPATHGAAAQDAAFLALYRADGTAPWQGDACIGP